jgi:hypothetical protein
VCRGLAYANYAGTPTISAVQLCSQDKQRGNDVPGRSRAGRAGMDSAQGHVHFCTDTKSSTRYITVNDVKETDADCRRDGTAFPLVAQRQMERNAAPRQGAHRKPNQTLTSARQTTRLLPVRRLENALVRRLQRFSSPLANLSLRQPAPSALRPLNPESKSVVPVNSAHSSTGRDP